MRSACTNKLYKLALLLLCVSQLPAETLNSILARSLANTHGSAIVLDWNTGLPIASAGPEVRDSPGSTLKPLFLEYALDQHIVSAETTVYCRRNLRIGNRQLPCSHPPDEPALDAQDALAESCNTWFAEMAKRFSGPQLDKALKQAHLQHLPMESTTLEQRQLAVLGLYGVSASPLELARAYRSLLLYAPQSGPVIRGLKSSVDYGMANPAHVQGITILGKTGTAGNDADPHSHGWFAGAVPGQFVLVIYVPDGSGGNAAALAARFLSAAAVNRHAR